MIRLSRRTGAVTSVGLALLTLLGGCGPAVPDGAAPTACPAAGCPAATPIATPTVAPPPTATAVPTPTPAFSSERAVLDDVTWTTAVEPETNAPVAPVDVFTVADRMLYAAVRADRIAAGTRIGADWAYNDTSLDGFAQEIVIERDTSNAWIAFHLELTGAEVWPNGRYQITITVDGTPALTSVVNVLSPGG
jgi:hypothetical protein